MTGSPSSQPQATAEPARGANRHGATRQLVDGAARGFFAEALILPTGLVTASVLARVLGPNGYGAFALVASIAGWVTYSTSALLGRASVKVISESPTWATTATFVLRARLQVGVLAALVLLGMAAASRWLFDVAGLAPLLAVMSLDVLLFNIARAYRETLTGVGRYRDVATTSAIRWLVRMVLIVALVWWTRSVMAAVIASVLTTLVECFVVSRFVTVPWRRDPSAIAPSLWRTAFALVAYGLAFHLQTRADLFAVSSLARTTGDSAHEVGWYGAAQNLSVVPGLFMMTVAPLLLATLGRLQRKGHVADAQALASAALRATVGFAALSAIVATCATPIVMLVYGPEFANAGALLVPLFAAGQCLSVVAVCTSILTAADRARAVSWLGAVLLFPALIAHVIVVPRYGAQGAALVTLGSAFITSVLAIAMVVRTWPMPVWSPVLRAAALSAALYLVGTRIETTQWWTLTLKLLVLGVVLIGGLLLLRLISLDSLRAVERQDEGGARGQGAR